MATVHTDIESVPAAAQGAVLALGNFDGVHQGHRALIRRAKEMAVAAKAPLGVVTFEPHPRQFFQPEGDPFRLTLLPMKARLLAALGVDHIFALPFNAALASLTAEAFIDTVLLQALKARGIVVGENFAFGHKRSGHVGTLKACASFTTEALAPVAASGGAVYSSTSARTLLREGAFAAAEDILGWPWQIEAPVVHGDKRGRTLGMPTANQNVPELLRIPYGVYAVRVLVEGSSQWQEGVANFGVRPMFEIRQPIFETHIFGHTDEIYGKMLRVQPVRHLRAEKKFESLDALVAQMKDDCVNAAAVLKSSLTRQP